MGVWHQRNACSVTLTEDAPVEQVCGGTSSIPGWSFCLLNHRAKPEGTNLFCVHKHINLMFLYTPVAATERFYEQLLDPDGHGCGIT